MATTPPTLAPAMSPDRILGLGFGFFAAQTLMTAVEMGVFSLLAGQALTASELENRLALHPRATADFLDALVALKLLDKDRDAVEWTYRNSPEASLFLDQASDDYVGGILIMARRRLYRYWADLDEALRTGRPQSEVKHQEKGLFDEIFQDPTKLRDFCAAMTGLSRQNFHKFSEIYPFGRHKTHLDVGASMGLLSRLVVERHPGLRSIAFDLPEVAAIARESLAAWGVADRVEVKAGSFLNDPLPRADVITLGNILHDWNLPTKKHIIQACHNALSDGGALVVIENLIDDDRRNNAFGLLMSLNMLVEFGDAFDCTFQDLEGWCRELGFRRFERLHVHGPCSALVAIK